MKGFAQSSSGAEEEEEEEREDGEGFGMDPGGDNATRRRAARCSTADIDAFHN